MDKYELEGIIEALLFTSGESVEIKQLAQATEQSEERIREAIASLKARYEEQKSGISLIEVNDAFQLCTNADYYDYIKRLYQVPPKKTLSTTLLETLAIIAYRQPITKGMIEEIRGVNADHAVNKLVEYDLVCEKGRLDAPGRPILFGTTEEFLRFFGFSSLENMPGEPEASEAMKHEAEEEIASFTAVD